MKTFIFGKTENNLPIEAFEFGHKGPRVLILGGVHGDEVEGVAMCKAIWAHYRESFPFKLKLTIVPTFNLDGVLAKTRHNANGIDLNRNLPTNDWNKEAFNARYYPGEKANSESENKALVQYIENQDIDFLISYHSFHRYLMNVNGDCITEALIMQELTDYPIEEEMGYPTPGCLGTYTGLERNIPTITYELKRGEQTKSFVPLHLKALHECLKHIEKTKNQQEI